jgi:SurA N-terminal domain
VSIQLVRTRTKGAVIALASVLLLGGCAAGTHPGAAAVVGGTEISVKDVDSTSEAVTTALGQAFGTSVTLNQLVQNALVAKVVDQRSVNMTDAEVAAAMKAVVGDQAAYDRFTKDPVANDFLREVARAAVGTVKLGGGTSITDQTAQQSSQAGTQIVTDASKNIKIEIAPRFGQWVNGQISGVSGSLSEESPQAKAQREAQQQQQQQQQPQG